MRWDLREQNRKVQRWGMYDFTRYSELGGVEMFVTGGMDVKKIY